jgi:hypothetical protein
VTTLVIHTTGDPYAIVPQVKSPVLTVMPDVPLRNVKSMEEVPARRAAAVDPMIALRSE